MYVCLWAAVIVGGVLASSALAAGSARDARIAGRVIECNTPEHCVRGHFKVVAIDSAGRTVATTSTSSRHNAYRLRVAAGSYRLVARTHGGLKCQASAKAVAHRTTHQNITCLVP